GGAAAGGGGPARRGGAVGGGAAAVDGAVTAAAAVAGTGVGAAGATSPPPANGQFTGLAFGQPPPFPSAAAGSSQNIPVSRAIICRRLYSRRFSSVPSPSWSVMAAGRRQQDSGSARAAGAVG